jgi:hypothetical protein
VTRPFWLTEAQATSLGFDWDAAPCDPAGDVEVAIFAYDHGQIRRAWTVQERCEYSARAELVLRALGAPDA